VSIDQQSQALLTRLRKPPSQRYEAHRRGNVERIRGECANANQETGFKEGDQKENCQPQESSLIFAQTRGEHDVVSGPALYRHESQRRSSVTSPMDTTTRNVLDP